MKTKPKAKPKRKPSLEEMRLKAFGEFYEESVGLKWWIAEIAKSHFEGWKIGEKLREKYKA